MSTKDQNEVLRQYVGDMLAVDKHIHEAVRRQRDDKNVQQHSEAHQVIGRVESMLDQQISELEQHLDRLGGSASSPVKDVVSSTLGAIAGLYDKVRSSTASKMLRDDYTALSLAAISYTMLQTTGKALHDETTASLALRHLKAVAPQIMDISRVVPLVVAKELAEDETNADTTVGPESVRMTQTAWDADNTRQSW